MTDVSLAAGQHSGAGTKAAHAQRVTELVQRVATDLSMIIERDVRVLSCDVQRSADRAGGSNVVHISLKQAYRLGERSAHGCLLVPLSDALTLAGFFLMLPDDVVEAQRSLSTVDAITKDALLEVASFVAGSLASALGGAAPATLEIRSASCQGLRPGALPALTHEAGSEWWIARAQIQIHAFAPADVVLLLPSLVDDAL
jgi:hypothetical protein